MKSRAVNLYRGTTAGGVAHHLAVGAIKNQESTDVLRNGPSTFGDVHHIAVE
jgi:hypothetical protein